MPVPGVTALKAMWISGFNARVHCRFIFHRQTLSSPDAQNFSIVRELYPSRPSPMLWKLPGLGQLNSLEVEAEELVMVHFDSASEPCWQLRLLRANQDWLEQQVAVYQTQFLLHPKFYCLSQIFSSEYVELRLCSRSVSHSHFPRSGSGFSEQISTRTSGSSLLHTKCIPHPQN
jgi:hypothetical protein